MNYLQDVYLSNFNLVFNTGSFLSLNKNENWEIENERFDQSRFYFIVEGNCNINIEGTDYHGQSGDWFFIPAGVVNSYKNDNSDIFKKYWIHFDIYPDSKIFKILNLPYKISVPDKKAIALMFKKIICLYNSNNLVDKIMIKSITLNLFAEYIKLSKLSNINVLGKVDKRLENILRFINENLDKDLNIETLSEKYYTHPNHFIRDFKSKTGVTPAKYVRLQRMDMAKRLLETSDLTNCEITEKIGLKDEFHFSKLFKKTYGTTPKLYKKHYKKTIVKSDQKNYNL